jgi:hypothetical protein
MSRRHRRVDAEVASSPGLSDHEPCSSVAQPSGASIVAAGASIVGTSSAGIEEPPPHAASVAVTAKQAARGARRIGRWCQKRPGGGRDSALRRRRPSRIPIACGSRARRSSWRPWPSLRRRSPPSSAWSWSAAPGPSAPWTDAATEARLGDGAELAVVVIARDRGRRWCSARSGALPLALAGRRCAPGRRGRPRRFAVRWSIVEPHGFRTGPGGQRRDLVVLQPTCRPSAATSGAGSATTASSTSRPRCGRGRRRAAARIPAAITSGDPRAIAVPGVGTTRYKVEVRAADGARSWPAPASRRSTRSA